MSPIMMIFEGATVTLSNNVIRGGGASGVRASGVRVAGVRVAGTIIADKNHFDGRSLRAAGPPNFAIWGLPGSRMTMTGNRINGWRHALQSSEGAVIATGNSVKQFHKAGFVITKGQRRNYIGIWS